MRDDGLGSAHPGVALGRARRDNGTSGSIGRHGPGAAGRDRAKVAGVMGEAANTDTRGRADGSAYAFWTRDTVRFSDIDRYRHINNVAVATYCETGRVEFAERLWAGSTAGEGAGWVIAKLTVSFLAQAHYPGHVEIGTRVERVGRTSCIFGQGLFKDGACFATAEAVLVWLDLADGGRPVPFPLALAERLHAEASRPELTAA